MLLILKGKCGNYSSKDQRSRLARIGYLSENVIKDLNQIINGLKDKISTIVTKPFSAAAKAKFVQRWLFKYWKPYQEKKKE